ncbi:MAG TPA: phenylalanine--tRNA ligase subunit beta [Bosea sp. (in: a-proteobacteria)]|jgi:phenylalanyl-tRNA synthetase beta chain|uniref:phenylalanine--tRNA ligase subunit beta n=1 Tax=Bosea sp. (in: a-proteobacteria) TaxID=1871050 RepID=UPI002DDDB6EA|nr:phenylalanine--tRNA ligase subunit beta [Bosea sp. (in: a-proteobacteria)]HEV2553834.1 phenylalanine--tRNA ligase subunit beta [Bosea sp. (in: a-proteobacteria)]
MKFTLSWLKDHLDTTDTVEAITEALTRVGLEVEGVEDKAKALAAFTVAHVIDAKQHPNADRLRVCLVDTGAGEPVQVVCGAPNARTGMKSVFSPPGTYIPGKDITLGKGVIRGVESNGMLCSAAELQLSEDHDGIIDLPQDAPVGQPYAAYAGLSDPVIEIAVTPNRADALGVAGIARDLAAAGLGRTTTPSVAPVRGAFPCPVDVKLDFAPEDASLCPVFGLRLVRGVKNGPSPDWLQARLRAVGLRPINALVDITNFMTLDRNRPLHVFDAAKVKGDLVVRRARDGETIVALDGKTYTLTSEQVVIADEAGVESIAGIMGGEASGCDEGTTDVLVESALWDPLNIARSGRALGITSDARYRFERGVDPDFCRPGLDLATAMIVELCGGEPSEMVFAGELPDSAHAIDFPWSEVKRLTGLDLPVVEMKLALTSLGFHVSGQGERVKVAAPSWRADVGGKADLVEEILRIAGLDRVVSTPLPRITGEVIKPVLTVLQKRTRQAKRLLASRGMVEAVTWSFIDHEAAKLFGGGSRQLVLANPIAADLSDMRPSLLPGLIRAAQANADRGFGDVALFEVGQIFQNDQPEGQLMAATGLRRGTAKLEGAGRHWDGTAKPVDAFDAKADVMALLAGLGVPVGGLQVVPGGPAWAHPGRSATLRFGPKGVIGAFGELHPRILKALDVKGPLVAFEIHLDALPLPKYKPTKVKPKLALSGFQPVTRDFAFIVDQATAAGEMVKSAQNADRALISDVSVFDLYEGQGVEPGKKSVALAVTLQPVEKTLTEAEIEAVGAKIVAEMAKRYGAALRG